MGSDHVPSETVQAENGNSPFNPLCTRRQVLIWGGVSIAGLSALSPTFVLAADRPLVIMENAEGVVVADPVVCVGCGRCELACTEFNDGRAAPSLSRIKVDRNLNFGPRGAMAWREGHGNLGDGLIAQDLCKQCPHPVPCANMCPEHAIVVSPVHKARAIDPEKCTGCGICLRACPWEMISYDPDSRKATKCHLCRGKPKCVEACSAGELVSEPEIALFLERHVATPDTSIAGDVVTALLSRLILENEDLHTLSGAESRWYYSSRSMTGEYSRILLHAQGGARTAHRGDRPPQRPHIPTARPA